LISSKPFSAETCSTERCCTIFPALSLNCCMRRGPLISAGSARPSEASQKVTDRQYCTQDSPGRALKIGGYDELTFVAFVPDANADWLPLPATEGTPLGICPDGRCCSSCTLACGDMG
jgi:hypothetical protein